jgi:hypothetical protein
MPLMPSVPFGKPLLACSGAHVEPPSFDFQMPDPSPPDSSDHGVRTARHVVA